MNQQTCNLAVLITTSNIVPFAQNSSYPVFTRYSYLVFFVASSASRRSIQVQWTSLSNDWAAKLFSQARTIPQIHSNFDSILIPGVINSSLLNFVSSIQQQPTTNTTGSPSNPNHNGCFLVDSPRVSIRTRSSVEWLGALEIPWSSVSNKFGKDPQAHKRQVNFMEKVMI